MIWEPRNLLVFREENKYFLRRLTNDMATNITKEEVIEYISNMTVLELSELVKELENKFGVTAAVPVAIGGGAVPAGQAEEAVAEQTEFNVVLSAVGDKKIQVIKVVRALTGLGLKEAKALVDGVPGTIKEGISKEEAEKIKSELEEAGATVTIK
jgi:large subunit ribosomal protein L7/L12